MYSTYQIIHIRFFAALISVIFSYCLANADELSQIRERIVPHEAAYELNLVQVASGSQLVHVRGFMNYSWDRRCDGWASEQRLFLGLKYLEDRSLKFKAVSVTWESADGLRFRFNVNRGVVGQKTDHYSGEAILKKLGGAGHVYYDTPKGKSITLEAGTIFPSRHTLLLLKLANSAEDFNRQLVFDGAFLDGASPVTAVFFPKQKPIYFEKPLKGYLPESVYPMQIAFFPPANNIIDAVTLPDSEYKIFYQSNGIAPTLHLSFDEFKLRGNMIGFKRLKKIAC